MEKFVELFMEKAGWCKCICRIVTQKWKINDIKHGVIGFIWFIDVVKVKVNVKIIELGLEL